LIKEPDKHVKTQNSGITTSGPHFTEGMKKTESFDHYGHLNETIELSYNDKTTRNVVLFNCYWHDQDKKKKIAPKNDGYFTSINTEAQWYKKEPYILATQASKVMYLDDTINGKGWQYVQKFQPRNFYDVEENEKPNSKVAHKDNFTDP
jgi:hypothetical protein